MIIDQLWQVRLSPSDQGSDEMVAAAREAVDREDQMVTGFRVKLRYAIAHILHPVIHPYVQYRTFDPGTGRIIHWPGRYCCAKCNRGLIRQ